MFGTEELLGRNLAGCRIDGRLGRGGGGSVLRGTQEFLERPVAVKVLSSKLTRRKSFIERFEREGKILASLTHPNIAQVYSMNIDRGRHVMVMELVDGVDLMERIQEEGRLPPVEVAYIFVQVARALDAAASRSLIHRDVKPANIMLTSGGVAKLVDFGIASEADPGAARSKTVTGSVVYMSPEQAQGLPLDHRSDLYSLGISMWHALMGAAPYIAPTPRAVAMHHLRTPLPEPQVDVPAPLLDLMRRLTAKDPADRPRDAHEVIDALDAYLDDAPKAPWALVVEPDPGRGERFASRCADARCEAVVCANGADALAVLDLRRNLPSLSIVQLVLPGVDGMAIVRRIRRLGGDEAPPVVLAAASRDILDAAEAEAFRLGMRWAAVHEDATDAELAAAVERLARSGDAPPGPPTRTAPLDPHAITRVSRIRDLGLQRDGHLDDDLNAIVRRAADLLGVPIAFMSLVLDDEQWFKVETGLGEALGDVRSTPIEDAFCGVVARSGRPLIVNDASTHTHFQSNRLVKAGAVGAYAGAPMVAPDGTTFGTVCVLDTEPRQLSWPAMQSLVVLARRAAGVAQFGAPAALQRRDLEEQLGISALTELAEVRPELAVILLDSNGVIRDASPGVGHMFDVEPTALAQLDRLMFVEFLTSLGAPGTPLAVQMRVSVEAPYAARAEFDVAGQRLRWSAWPVAMDGERVQVERFERIEQATSTYDLISVG